MSTLDGQFPGQGVLLVPWIISALPGAGAGGSEGKAALHQRLHQRCAGNGEVLEVDQGNRGAGRSDRLRKYRGSAASEVGVAAIDGGDRVAADARLLVTKVA